MSTFQVAIKTNTPNTNSTNGVFQFLMQADSAEEIRETLGNDIDVARFLTWYGAVDLETGKLIDDKQEIPKILGRVTEMRILNIKDCGESDSDLKAVKDYDEMCRKYDFDLDEIYDFDWADVVC